MLRDDGSFWLNYGDAYSSGSGDLKNWKAGGGAPVKGIEDNRPDFGLPPKNLMGLPWRVAFALQDDGWILRSAIVWHKPNPMPESVRDRPTNAYEMVFEFEPMEGYENIFLFSKQQRYYYDAEAIRESPKPHSGFATTKGYDPPGQSAHSGIAGYKDYTSANARNVWTIPTQGRPDAHFATFPDEIPRRCILAGTSEHGVCADCGSQWVRMVERKVSPVEGEGGHNKYAPIDRTKARSQGFHGAETQTLGWQPTCDCGAAVIPATILDPFVGSGTSLAVAQSLGRRSIGLDLNAEYLAIAQRRIEAVSLPLIGAM